MNESTQAQRGRGSRWLGLVAMFGCGWWRWSPQACRVAEVVRLVGLGRPGYGLPTRIVDHVSDRCRFKSGLRCDLVYIHPTTMQGSQ